MRREIYEVNAKVVDATGAYNNLTGYPASFDSRHYDNDLEKTRRRAYGSYSDACKAGYNADGRPLTIITLLRISDGFQLASTQIGDMPELPDGGEE